MRCTVTPFWVIVSNGGSSFLFDVLAGHQLFSSYIRAEFKDCPYRYSRHLMPVCESWDILEITENGQQVISSIIMGGGVIIIIHGGWRIDGQVDIII